jgi:hypothetical protein
LKIDLEEKVADRIVFADCGKPISAGDSYFVRKEHGREARFTSIEAEKLMGLRDFSADKRKTMAKKGTALPDGSFPIASCQDAKNARQAIGRAKPSKRSKVMAHIKRREAALGCSS